MPHRLMRELAPWLAGLYHDNRLQQKVHAAQQFEMLHTCHREQLVVKSRIPAVTLTV